jgi:hypothetical protein
MSLCVCISDCVCVCLGVCVSVCLCVWGLRLATVSHCVSRFMYQRIRRELFGSVLFRAGLHAFFVYRAGVHAFFCFAMWYIAACPSVAGAGPDGAPCMHGRKSTFKHSNPWSFESADIVDANRDLHPMIRFVISISDMVACRLSATFVCHDLATLSHDPFCDFY